MASPSGKGKIKHVNNIMPQMALRVRRRANKEFQRSNFGTPGSGEAPRPLSYGDGEKWFLRRSQVVRDKALGPLAQLCLKLGVTADHLSYLSVLAGAGFLLAIYEGQLHLALVCITLAGFSDAFDGTLARTKGADSPAGAFTDTICDLIVTAFTIGGFVLGGWLLPLLGVGFVFVYTTIVLFFILHSFLHVSSTWIFRPSRFLLYALFALRVFNGLDLINPLVIIYLPFSFSMLILSFVRLRRAI